MGYAEDFKKVQTEKDERGLSFRLANHLHQGERSQRKENSSNEIPDDSKTKKKKRKNCGGLKKGLITTLKERETGFKRTDGEHRVEGGERG